MTRIHVGLLGPCFKTGRVEPRLFAHREGERRCCEQTDDAAPRSDRRESKTRIIATNATMSYTGGSPDAASVRLPRGQPLATATTSVPAKARASDALPTHRGDLLRGENRPPAPGRGRAAPPRADCDVRAARSGVAVVVPKTPSRLPNELNPPSSIFESPPV